VGTVFMQQYLYSTIKELFPGVGWRYSKGLPGRRSCKQQGSVAPVAGAKFSGSSMG